MIGVELVAVGDTFRRVIGPEAGRVYEVSEVDREDNTALINGHMWVTIEALSSETVWQRVRAVELPPDLMSADPLFAELAELEAERSIAAGGPKGDDAREPDEWLADASEDLDNADATIGDPEGGGDATCRASMMRAAMLCLAAVRVIDRAHPVSP